MFYDRRRLLSCHSVSQSVIQPASQPARQSTDDSIQTSKFGKLGSRIIIIIIVIVGLELLVYETTCRLVVEVE